MIISASRRTDIPAFFAREFMESIHAGFRIVRNPYSGRETRLSLAPADVECIVFWSKNPEPLLPFLTELEERGYRFYFQFTFTPYGTDIERCLPPKRRILRTFRSLSERIGAEKVIWRYDPILFSTEWTAERNAAFSGNRRKRRCWNLPPRFPLRRNHTVSAFPPARNRST